MSRRLAAIAASALFLSLAATQAEAARKFITFDGVCDVATVTSQADLPNVWAYLETPKMGSCGKAFGVGTVGKAVLNGIDARWISFGLTSSQSTGNEGNLVVQYPLVTGGAWMFYVTGDGETVNIVSQGTYTIGHEVGAAKNAPDFAHAK